MNMGCWSLKFTFVFTGICNCKPCNWKISLVFTGICNREDVVPNWIPPLTSWMKINFDGACELNLSRVGLGAVTRDEFGKLRGALAIPVFSSLSPLSTEALALLNGLKYCRELGVSKIEIEGDALNVLKTLDADGID